MPELLFLVGIIFLSLSIVWTSHELKWFRGKQHELNGSVLGALGDLIERVQALEGKEDSSG